mgnify:CR=1 FL=1
MRRGGPGKGGQRRELGVPVAHREKLAGVDVFLRITSAREDKSV